MEDFETVHATYELEPRQSKYPAYAFRLSARDLARIGQLCLQKGQWNGATLLPVAWLSTSVKPHTDFGNGRGYGYMWWTYEPGSLESYPVANNQRLYVGKGTGGQLLLIAPELDLVFVHRSDTDHERHVRGGAVWRLFEKLLAAKMTEPTKNPALIDMGSTPLDNVVPAAPQRTPITLPASTLARYTGAYQFGPRQTAKVFLHDGRLFVSLPGLFEGEMFPESETDFFFHPVMLHARFVIDDTEKVIAVEISRSGKVMPLLPRITSPK